MSRWLTLAAVILILAALIVLTPLGDSFRGSSAGDVPPSEEVAPRQLASQEERPADVEPATQVLGSAPHSDSDSRSVVPTQPDPTEAAARYAETLQTGVFGEEPMPQFAQQYLYPSDAERQKALASHEQLVSSPTDQWSAAMEAQLRSFFSQNSRVYFVHISILCRSTQCQLQLVEKTVRVQPDLTPGPHSIFLLTNMAREQWFVDNFIEWTVHNATPVSAEVAYQTIVLPRRNPPR
jgi:hypothetical protein